jgi:hypothetical protein
MNKQQIQKELLYIGIKPSTKGFEYISTAIELYKPNTKMMDVYSAIAEKHDTKASRVERAIRHAKESLLNEYPVLEERIKERYGISIIIDEKFTNGDLIALMRIAIENMEGAKI